MTTRHVALLRGINVGGNNVIPMAALRSAFEGMGFTDVATLIASGNVVFSATTKSNKSRLTTKIERTLGETFGYVSRVVIATAEELARVVDEAPRGFGRQPDLHRYDVLFVREPVTPREALAQIPINREVDQVHAGAHALYFRRLVAEASKSRLSKIVQMPVYKELTIRNWSTTTKLLALAQGAGTSPRARRP
ncbi:MAG: DUF1697 domain-containing protein [Labilithrix sp.]|nr:DUF1697 domain-containing protein [Labilithrix sp.]MCW5836233.1 DUF1697 domain-containing protein [Labilithrix sp.]